MNHRSIAQESLQPKKVFKFSTLNLKKITLILEAYPADKKPSAVLPVLDLAQRQNKNWLSMAAMRSVADLLEMPLIKVIEVATFYTMFNLSPVGKNLLQICTTTPCWLRGSDGIYNLCKKKLGINYGETSKDNNFTLIEVECLGACSNAPMVQINDDYYEDLDEDSMNVIISKLKKNIKPKAGPQSSRLGSEPKI